MDLERELVAVLDNPKEVWEAVVNNLEPEARTLLLVFTTCSTPISMIAWQEAVARVSTEAAVSFEKSLRSLDDTFVSTNKDATGQLIADFRNPSMDDFCAAYLDNNVGMAVTVSSSGASDGQVRRLLELGTDRHTTGNFKFANIHQALVQKPSLLLDRLLGILPTDPRDQWRHRKIIDSVAILIGNARALTDAELNRVRASLANVLGAMDFTSGSRLLIRLMDDASAARGLHRLLGDDFSSFYDRAWHSASELMHFDSLVNFEDSVGFPGSDAPWRDLFTELSDSWLDGDYDDEADADSARDFYNKIAEHLDLQDLGRSDEWDDLVAAVADSMPAPQEEPEDDSWQSKVAPGSSKPTDISDLLAKSLDEVDAMFHGLANAERPDDA